ncbi:MAG: NAD(P)-binding domain-containing protein [Defluviitaleaceae bacterium]|nr:NAD(P)-binding domain-containing protein [Defluviitaleaceae bacterium]
MKIGFLGVGTIASCMIEGFCDLGDEHQFFLSPRNTQKSAALAERYGNVTVCDSNQHVVDQCEVVFISMLATNCLDVLRGLNFRASQRIINVVATIPPEDIIDAVGQTKSFSHVIPLPAIKHRIGPIAAYPESDFLANLLMPMGTIVFAKSMDEIRAMQAITGLMSAFYDMLHHLTIFAEAEGLGRKESTSFISTFFASLCHNVNDADFAELAAEMTPGGLNELAQRTLAEAGALKAWADVMGPVMERIKRA